MKKFYSSEKGLTLVELVVAMGIASFAIVAIMQLSRTSNDMFKRSEEISQRQMNVRVASLKVVENLRYAKFVPDEDVEFIGLADSDPTAASLAAKSAAASTPTMSVEYACIYLDSTEKTLFYIDKNGVKENLLMDMELEMDPEKSYLKVELDSLVSFKITEATDQYHIESKIKLLNADDEQIKDDKKDKKYKGIIFME